MYKENFPYTHAGLWLTTLLHQFPQCNRGQLYMERFCEACLSLKEQDSIQDFTVWEKNSPKDCMGVDVTITIDGKEIDFQVTSSLKNADKHIKTNNKHPERGTVRIVYVREGNNQVMKSISNLEKEILRKAALNFNKK